MVYLLNLERLLLQWITQREHGSGKHSVVLMNEQETYLPVYYLKLKMMFTSPLVGK